MTIQTELSPSFTEDIGFMLRFYLRSGRCFTLLRLPPGRRALMNLLRFWPRLLEEGLYGALDWLAYTYRDDWYVPHHRITGCFYPKGCGSYGHDDPEIAQRIEARAQSRSVWHLGLYVQTQVDGWDGKVVVQ